MQVFVVFSLISVLWASTATASPSPRATRSSAASSELLLSGVRYGEGRVAAATFSKGDVHPRARVRRVPGTFAAITCCLIVGAFAERMKFSRGAAVHGDLVHVRYMPIAHMVWYWDGPGRDQRCEARRRASNARPAGCGNGARSTSRAARWCTSTPVSPAWWRLHARQAHRLRQGSDGAAQPDADDGRRRAAVGGLVRLQRGLRPRGRQLRRARVRQHAVRHRCAVLAWTFGEWISRASRRCWAPPRARSPGWSRSRRPRGYVGIGGAFVIGVVAGLRLPVGRERPEEDARRGRLARRVRRARASAASSARCSPACSPRPRSAAPASATT